MDSGAALSLAKQQRHELFVSIEPEKENQQLESRTRINSQKEEKTIIEQRWWLQAKPK